MLSRLFAIYACTLLAGMAAVGQELEISVSPSPVGSGARAAGMADAFVAIADDATAAAWNPAGLVQLERPELAIVGEANVLFERFDAAYHDEVRSTHNASSTGLNFLSFTYPLPLLIAGRNAAVGLYYQRKYDFTRDFRLHYNSPQVLSYGWIVNQVQHLDFEQEGSLSALTPALAFEVTQRLSIGVGLNLWRDTPFAQNRWEQRQHYSYLAVSALGTSLSTSESEAEYRHVRGDSVSLGVLWNLTPRLTLGARYDSSWTARADYELRGWTWRGESTLSQGAPFAWSRQRAKETREVRFPATIAFGAAWRANDRLTLSLDVSRTDWNDFWYRGKDRQRRSLVNNANFDDLLFPAHFDATHTVRFGAEYVMIPPQPGERLDHLWSLRGGLFYDEEPASRHPDPFYGVAAGLGLLIRQRVNIDLAYQLRAGKGVNKDFIRGVRGFEEDVVQHRILLSTVIYF